MILGEECVFFKNIGDTFFIGYIILLACKGSNLLLTEMNSKLVGHVLLSAYWYWQFSRQHSLS